MNPKCQTRPKFDNFGAGSADSTRLFSMPINRAASSLDHLVGDLLEVGRHVETEHECRLRVDDELELARLHNRQFCRLRTLEDAAGVDASLTIGICDVGSITHQSTRFDRLAIRKRGRNCMACRQSDKLCTPDHV